MILAWAGVDTLKIATGEACRVLEDNRDLVGMDMETAVYLKHSRGRTLHGDEWVGPRPLVCLHEEILDAYVYADLEYARGEVDRTVLLEVMTSLINIRRGVQTLIRNVPESTWDGWSIIEQKKTEEVT